MKRSRLKISGGISTKFGGFFQGHLGGEYETECETPSDHESPEVIQAKDEPKLIAKAEEPMEIIRSKGKKVSRNS